MTYYSRQTETKYESIAPGAKLEFELAEDVKTYFVPGKLYKALKPMNYDIGYITSGAYANHINHPWYGTTTLTYTATTGTLSAQTITLGNQAAMYGASTIGNGAMLSSTQTTSTIAGGTISAYGHSTGVGSGITITGGTGGYGGIGGGLTIGSGTGITTGTGGAVTISGGSYGTYQTPKDSIVMLLDIKQISEERTQIKYLSKLKTYTLDFWPGKSSLASNYWPPEPQNLFEYLERCE